MSMSVAAAERLHVLAHRAARAARDENEWWGTPLDTALAAVTLARHSRAHRDVAEAALERMLRWWQDEHPRRISADVTALALTSRAAHELQRGDPALTRAAVIAVEDLASRDRAIVPELHLVIAAWALATIVPDRADAPWPALRSRFDRPQVAGVDEPLRRFGLGLAQQPFDANRLVQELLIDIGSAPALGDAVILLWLVSAAADELARFLPTSDNALQVLLRRRAELVERLAGEIDEGTFIEQEIEEFDPSNEFAPVEVTYLSPFEALLLDLALASRDDATPWLTYDEAHRLFGEQAETAKEELEQARRGHASVAARLVVVIAALGAVTSWFVMRDLDIAADVSYPAAAALASLLCAVAVALAARERTPGLVAAAAGSFFVACAIIAGFIAVNNAPKKPLIAGVSGVAADILFAAGGILIWAILVAVLRARRPASP
jgi:hypothetical protein